MLLYQNELQQVLDIFNSKCDCEKIEINFIIKKSKDDFEGFVLSQIEQRSFEGTYKEVVDSIENYFKVFGLQIIELCLANIEEWYDNNSIIQDKLLELYSFFLGEIDNG